MQRKRTRELIKKTILNQQQLSDEKGKKIGIESSK